MRGWQEEKAAEGLSAARRGIHAKRIRYIGGRDDCLNFGSYRS